MTDAPLVRIIDDDDSLRTALSRLLRAAGYEARGYATAEDFLREPPSDRPGCVLLDVSLPGLSGLNLQTALQAMGIMLPLVFLTGHATEAARARAMQAGAVAFIDKPIESHVLFDVVNRALAQDRDLRAARDQGSSGGA